MLRVELNLFKAKWLQWCSFSFYMPQKWDELTPEQWRQVYPLLSQTTLRFYSEAKLVAIFMDVLGWRNIGKQLWLAFSSADAKLQLQSLVKWVFDTELDLTKNPVPQIKIKNRVFYGPGAGMKQLGFLEYFKCEQVLRAWHKNKNRKHLVVLMAQLYRLPKASFDPLDPKFKGDIRLPYDQTVAKELEKVFAAVDDVTLALVLNYFEFNLKRIIDAYQDLFPKPEENKPTFSDRANAEAVADLLLEVAERGVFGNIDQVGLEPITNIFQFLKKEKRKEK
jgi:hypothetical protein